MLIVKSYLFKSFFSVRIKKFISGKSHMIVHQIELPFDYFRCWVSFVSNECFTLNGLTLAFLAFLKIYLGFVKFGTCRIPIREVLKDIIIQNLIFFSIFLSLVNVKNWNSCHWLFILWNLISIWQLELKILKWMIIVQWLP